MSGPLDSDNQDRSLWRQYAARAQTPQAPPVDANTLAAYLDGSAEPEDIQLVETRMASDPGFVEEVLALRQIADLEPPLATASVLNRAKALTLRHTWWTRMQWAAAAAAVLLACFAGYRVGSTTQLGHRDAQMFASLQISLEIDELISEPAVGIILPLNGHNGNGR